MKIFVRTFLLVTFTVASGCVPAYKVSLSSPSESPSFTIVDKRTETEKQGGSRSKLITSCEYGITDLGESDIEPPRLEILKNRLQTEKDLREKLKDKTIEVTSFKIIRNWQVHLRKGIDKNYTGALAKAMIAGCFAGPEIEGSYLPAENPQGLPSFTVILVAKIGEKTLNVRHFETANSLDETRSMVESNILPRVLNNSLRKLVQAIRTQINQ